MVDVSVKHQDYLPRRMWQICHIRKPTFPGSRRTSASFLRAKPPLRRSQRGTACFRATLGTYPFWTTARFTWSSLPRPTGL